LSFVSAGRRQSQARQSGCSLSQRLLSARPASGIAGECARLQWRAPRICTSLTSSRDRPMNSRNPSTSSAFANVSSSAFSARYSTRLRLVPRLFWVLASPKPGPVACFHLFDPVAGAPQLPLAVLLDHAALVPYQLCLFDGDRLPVVGDRRMALVPAVTGTERPLDLKFCLVDLKLGGEPGGRRVALIIAHLPPAR